VSCPIRNSARLKRWCVICSIDDGSRRDSVNGGPPPQETDLLGTPHLGPEVPLEVAPAALRPSRVPWGIPDARWPGGGGILGNHSNVRRPLSPRRSTSSTSTTACTSSSHLRRPTPMLPPRGERADEYHCITHQLSPSPTNAMLSPRGEAPARRVTLHHPAAVTIANQRRCSLPEEKHQLDEHHCITQQQSPSPTNADDSSPRRSTSAMSTTASPSSGHYRQPPPMLPSRREASAHRVILHHPVAVTFAT
jgi:hypothetical protein